MWYPHGRNRTNRPDSPILYRTSYLLTPPSELPKLPEAISSYWPIHAYTATQIVATVVVFIVTLTVAGPAFPIIIIALVPIRLLIMNRVWNREVLRYVDAWACRDGTPEGDLDRLAVRRALDIEMVDAGREVEGEGPEGVESEMFRVADEDRRAFATREDEKV